MVNIWPLLTAQPVPMLQSAWWLILAAWGIHTAVTGLFVWLLKRSIDKRDKRREAELPGVFNVAWKTRLSGALESNAGFKGLFRKAMTLVFVLVGHRPRVALACLLSIAPLFPATLEPWMTQFPGCMRWIAKKASITRTRGRSISVLEICRHVCGSQEEVLRSGRWSHEQAGGATL